MVKVCYSSYVVTEDNKKAWGTAISAQLKLKFCHGGILEGRIEKARRQANFTQRWVHLTGWVSSAGGLLVYALLSKVAGLTVLEKAGSQGIGDLTRFEDQV